jgi:type I restriction enzyme S subunit
MEDVLEPRLTRFRPGDPLLTGCSVVAKVRFADGMIELRPDANTRTQMILAYPGDLLISGINATKGAVALVATDAPIAASIHYGAYAVSPELATAKFIWRFLRSPVGQQAMRAAMSGGIKSELRWDDLRAIRLRLPSLSDQEGLLGLLGAIEGRVGTARSLASPLVREGAVMDAVLDYVFGDPYASRPGRLGGRVRPLEAFVDDVADGPHKTPNYVDSGVPFVTALNLTTGRLTLSPTKFITMEEHRQFQARARAEPGDVLITKDGSIGNTGLVDTDAEFSFFVSVALIKPSRSLLDGSFLLWLLRAPATRRRIRERARGDMIKHLVLREIRALLCPDVSLSVQRAAVAEIEQVAIVEAKARGSAAMVARDLESLLGHALAAAFRRSVGSHQ